MKQVTVPAFTKGTHNLLQGELVPPDAATDSTNWMTRDGKIVLAYGRTTQGGDGAAGRNYGEHTAYKVDGTAVRFRKVDTKVQYLNGTTWTDVITGLVAGDCTFSNYQSLAGSFVYIFDPLNGIYKICVANPGSHSVLYDAAKNFKGYAIIDKGRSYLWGREQDPTGLYYSWADNQLGVSGATGVYTTVTNEAITAVESGTLAFKAGGATRTCFNVRITDTSSSEVFTDNYNGVLIGSGGTNVGTINYTTGEFTITGQTGAGTATYQWENSNLRGVTDFSFSATRLPGEGNIIRQDDGGDKIRVVIPYEGSYYSLKARSVYKLTISSADSLAGTSNELIRSDVGINSLRAATGTSAGIIFMNTANPTEPRLHILEKNPYGDNILLKPLFPHYNFANFNFDDVMVSTWDKYIIVACAEETEENDRLLLCDLQTSTVDKTTYGIRCVAKSGNFLYGGDPVSNTTYELFTDFDDLGLRVENEWIGAPTLLETTRLKKVKRMRFKGEITPDQAIEVYISRDNGDWLIVGTILGSGDYIDYSTSFSVGTTLVGSGPIGGNDEVPVYTFYMQLKLKGEKFRQRRVKFIATGIGYCALQQITDFDILEFEEKIPKTYRNKQNVSIDGEDVDLDYATFV